MHEKYTAHVAKHVFTFSPMNVKRACIFAERQKNTNIGEFY